MKRHWYLPLLILPLTAYAQPSRLAEDVSYSAQLVGTAGSGSQAPFWFTNNRYGLGDAENGYAYLRASLQRSTEADRHRHWRLGYGADAVVSTGMQSHLVLQQLYADVEWQALRLSVGQKERPLELRDQQLSTGGMTTGINARPLPQVRLELPRFWSVPRTGGWLALKAHVAYGAYTDNRWQRHFNDHDLRYLYTTGSLYHSKALFVRVGNVERFPLTLTGGLEMSCQFGGTGHNLRQRVGFGGPEYYDESLLDGVKSFWNALIPGGGDSNDGDVYSNREGNHLGSWHLRADYHGTGWGAAVYMEHFFEDQSQMFWQYGWKDKLWGFELTPAENPFLSSLVVEFVGTMDQSGAIYHDRTSTIPEQISGCDQYYNNHIYGAWQHAGFVMGNPLLSSPIYNDRFGMSHNLMVYHSRIRAFHLGLSGQPSSQLGWRILYTHEKSLGSYNAPTPDPQKANFLLLELTCKPRRLQGLALTASYGHNDGKILGNSNAAMLSVAYSGWIKHETR